MMPNPNHHWDYRPVPDPSDTDLEWFIGAKVTAKPMLPNYLGGAFKPYVWGRSRPSLRPVVRD